MGRENGTWEERSVWTAAISSVAASWVEGKRARLPPSCGTPGGKEGGGWGKERTRKWSCTRLGLTAPVHHAPVAIASSAKSTDRPAGVPVYSIGVRVSGGAVCEGERMRRGKAAQEKGAPLSLYVSWEPSARTVPFLY